MTKTVEATVDGAAGADAALGKIIDGVVGEGRADPLLFLREERKSLADGDPKLDFSGTVGPLPHDGLIAGRLRQRIAQGHPTWRDRVV